MPRTPAGFLSGTHKNYSLVDCPIYSVVKYRPRDQLSAVGFQLLAKSLHCELSSPPERVWVLLKADS